MQAGGDSLLVPLSGPAPAVSPSADSFYQRIRKGGALFGVAQVLGMAVGFLSGMVMVRVAGQRDVASYMLLQQAIMSVSLILQLGLGPAALRFAPVSRGQGGDRATALLRRRLLGLQLLLWSVVVPGLALAWPWIARKLDAPELAHATPFLLAAAMLVSFGNLLDSYLRAFRMYRVSAPLSQLVPRALILGGFLGLWATAAGQVPWEGLAAIYGTALLVTAIGYALALTATTDEETSEPRAAIAPPPMREILSTSTAMGLRSAASVLYVSSSLWILSWARPHEEVAVYGVAATLLQILAAIPAMTSFVIPQEFSLLYSDGRQEEMERLARTASTVVAGLSLASLLGLLLFGRLLIRIAYGAPYVGAWSILMILAVGSFWDAASGGAGYVLQMTGHHTRLLLLTLGGGLLNLVLSFVLAPLWGGQGIAIATTLTLIVFNLATVATVKRLVGVRTFVYRKPSDWLHTLQLVGLGKEGRNPR
ncbi:MAG TPA: lipopolysaccharide biosynthesis protein [Thermoanaerobaculia bacterium]|nr:lipopolysaccharide biosynthesis protein [Thermoanaerobaculia bacterium]